MDVIISYPLNAILSVSTKGVISKVLNITINIETAQFGCQNVEEFAQKLVGAKQEFIDEQTIEARCVIIEAGRKDSADDILKKRLARGEIDLKEFHDKIQRT